MLHLRTTLRLLYWPFFFGKSVHNRTTELLLSYSIRVYYMYMYITSACVSIPP